MEDRGALLQRIINAMNSGCAGESRQAAIARFAATRGKGVKEMGAFIDDVVARGKTIERVGVEGGVPSEETERELKGMYAEAEGVLLKRPVTPTEGLIAIIATARGWEYGEACRFLFPFFFVRQGGYLYLELDGRDRMGRGSIG